MLTGPARSRKNFGIGLGSSQEIGYACRMKSMPTNHQGDTEMPTTRDHYIRLATEARIAAWEGDESWNEGRASAWDDAATWARRNTSPEALLERLALARQLAEENRDAPGTSYEDAEYFDGRAGSFAAAKTWVGRS